MKHIILAGDSIFDNGSYVKSDEPDVGKQLQEILDENDKVTMLAIDGDIIRGVANQLKRLPEDATHLFISVGGNDALLRLQTFNNPVSNIGEGFYNFYSIKQEFERMYGEMLSHVKSYNIKTTFCTIYHPRFSNNNLVRISEYFPTSINSDVLQQITMTALPIFNDIIFQEAVKFGYPIMDLRLIFNEESDYANPIEPSAKGGLKMVKVIKQIIYNHDFSLLKSVVYK